MLEVWFTRLYHPSITYTGVEKEEGPHKKLIFNCFQIAVFLVLYLQARGAACLRRKNRILIIPFLQVNDQSTAMSV